MFRTEKDGLDRLHSGVAFHRCDSSTECACVNIHFLITAGNEPSTSFLYDKHVRHPLNDGGGSPVNKCFNY